MTQTPGQEPPAQEPPKKPRTRRMAPTMARFVAISWRDLAISFGPILLISAAAIYLAVRLIQPAPPSTLTIAAGTKGSSFWNSAQKDKTILARTGVRLTALETRGALRILHRLDDPIARGDVGFVQGGVSAPGATHDNLMSVGS